MIKHILTILCLLTALILPAGAATKPHHSKHGATQSRGSAAVRKPVRPSARHRSKSSATRRGAAHARRHKTVKQ